jgi:hypothetical protein
MRMRRLIMGVGCGLLVWCAGGAEPASRPPATRSEVDQQLSQLGQQQVTLAFSMRDQTQKNESLWLDPQYTSPEIESLRKRMAALQQELMQVQQTLRTRVAELPAAQAELAKLAQWKTTYQALSQQIEEFKKRRAQMP